MSEARPRLPPLPPDLLRERAPSRLGSALYLLALVGFAFWDLSGRSIFHHDMPRFATIAREMIRSGDWLVPTQYGDTYANKPILYIWLVAFASLVPGDPTALTLRIPSALALVATGLATSVWGRARSGSVAVGRVAGLVAVTTYSLHELGRVGRPDMLSTAFATIAAALCDRALLGHAGRRAWIGIGLALGGGFLSKGPVVLLIPAALVLLPRASTSLRIRTGRVRLDLAFAVAVAVSALWIVPAGLHGGWGYVKRLAFDQVADRVRGDTGHNEPVWYYLAAAPQSWLPWSPIYLLTACLAATKRGRAHLGSTSHLGATLVAFAVLCAMPTKEIRYAAFLVPPLAVTVAQFLHSWALGSNGRRDEAQAASPSDRTHLGIGGVVASLLALAAAWPLFLWPSTTPWLLPLALVVLVCGACAVRASRRPLAARREIRGRFVGLAVVLAACGAGAYWSVFGRYLVVVAVHENRAVAAALDPSIPSVIVGGIGVDMPGPDQFYEGAPSARFVRSVSELKSIPTTGSIQLVALAIDRAAIEERLGATRVLLERVRDDGRTLLVLIRDR